jgi:hypothetical protein
MAEKRTKRGRYTARLDGDVVVVRNALHVPQLPAVCMKCGTHAGIMRRKVRFQWRPMWAHFLVFCIIGIIVLFMTTRRANLEIPLCAPCNARWSLARNLSLAGLFVVLVPFAALRITDPSSTRLALAALLPGIVVLTVFRFLFVRPRVLPVERIDDDEIRLKGVAPSAAQEIVAGSD